MIIDYKNAYNVKIQFLSDGYQKWVSCNDIRRGKIRNPFSKTIYGVGYLGNYDKDKVSLRCKSTWRKMLERCYNEALRDKYKAYNNCSVCSDWHSLENFSKFFINCPYRKDNWFLDKDIIERYNKKYDPAKCAFVPSEINNSVVFSEIKRGQYPIGVVKNEKAHKTKPFISKITDIDGKIVCGYFKTEEEAFYSYKLNKEKKLHDLAEKWKGEVDPRVIESLRNWKIFDIKTGMGL